MNTLTLTVDSRKRICLAKLFNDQPISSVRAYRENDKIILEPMAEIPAREIWLYQNKDALLKVRNGLSQTPSVKKGSFSKYATDEI